MSIWTAEQDARTPMRRWECPHGHITESKYSPDVCRKCKETETALWLTRFKEVIDERN